MAVLLQPGEGVLKLYLLLLLFPGLLINGRTVGWALRRAGVSYEGLSVEASAPSLLDKRLTLAARGVCFEHPRARGCFSVVELDVTVRLWRPKLLAVDRLVLVSRDLSIAPAPKKPPAEREPPRLRLPPLPRLGVIRVDVPAFAYGPLGGSVFAFHKDQAFALRARLPQGEVDAGGAYSEDFLDLAARAKSGPREADLIVRVSTSSARLRLNARVPGKSLKALLSGTPRRVRGDVTVLTSTGPIREARLTRCDARREGETGSVTCGIRLVPGLVGGRAAPLKAMDGVVRAEGRVEDGDRFEAKAALDLGPARHWYELSIKARATAKGRLGRLKQAEVEHQLEAVVDVPRFERVVELLGGTAFAVPAPLHVLRGPLRLKANGSSAELELEAASDLASEKQRVKLAASGAARLLERPPRLEADIVLEDVALELPRLDIGPAPDVTVDPRIKVSTAPGPAPEPPARRKPPPRLDLRATVKTGKPARLLSNLAKEPLPVELDLRVQPPKLAGRIDVGSFDVELFRRRMTVDHFDLVPTGTGVFDMDGLILYTTADVTVKIMLVGSTKKPRVEFLSEPPMERDQIIALLLFNKPPDQLDDAEQESVGNTQNALASNALGLATLYLFASTPIESVAYDPATQGYSVRFKLPGGASMEVGGDDETKRLRLRKRLASHWALQTEVRTEEESGNAVTTFLEWFNRF